MKESFYDENTSISLQNLLKRDGFLQNGTAQDFGIICLTIMNGDGSIVIEKKCYR